MFDNTDFGNIFGDLFKSQSLPDLKCLNQDERLYLKSKLSGATGSDLKAKLYYLSSNGDEVARKAFNEVIFRGL
jgi:hypothetical protein